MTAEWRKKYRWERTWPDDRGPDGKPPEDYSAYDGERYAGRIRLDRETLKKGQFQWSGAYPKPMHGVAPIMPHTGWAPTAAEAAQKVESYWDAMKAKIEREGQ